MPRRKKLPETSDIIGLGNPDKLTVQKSNPLQSLAKTNLTLPELKLLDVYLARIDSHDPEKRTVIIEKGELERVLCVTRILKDDLNKRLRNLFQIVEIEDATKPDGFKIIQLASEDVVNLPEAPTTEQSQHKYIALKVAEIKRRNQEKNL